MDTAHPRPRLDDVTSLYGESYQADAAAENRIAAWRAIAGAIASQFPAARTTLDVGCGAGRLSLEFERLGLEAWGIEGSQAALGKLPAKILLWDLRVPLTILKPFDLVTCFDVGEHVGAAEALADTVCGATAEWLLFGAATPDQGGHGHIDCRPHEDWHKLFADRGLVLNLDLTNDLKAAISANSDHNFLWWVERNLHVYRRWLWA